MTHTRCDAVRRRPPPPGQGTLDSVPTLTRPAAVAALAAALLGAVGLYAATHGAADLSGYVSEAGVLGAPRAILYRVSIFGIAAAVALLALALRTLSLPAAVLLALAVPGVVLSGTVRCSTGCPLPPYEPTTAADLVHAGASIAGMLLFAGGLFFLALAGADPAVRSTSRIAAAVVVPVQALAGLSIVFAGRGMITGVLERAALAASLGWLLAVAATLARPVRNG